MLDELIGDARRAGHRRTEALATVSRTDIAWDTDSSTSNDRALRILQARPETLQELGDVESALEIRALMARSEMGRGRADRGFEIGRQILEIARQRPSQLAIHRVVTRFLSAGFYGPRRSRNCSRSSKTCGPLHRRQSRSRRWSGPCPRFWP